ncbi:MAG TPA: glycerol-3-phosphate dehydrogenase/oxidase [Humisphaera sp.]|nr:glycerol-3-phosphate dehydrogenase/oxidase [Humisphaera sp.]
MQRNLTSLAEGKFDLLIIGGGIFGAGIARDAAMRGLRVALVEQNDFASGTSSQSSKLIHGGFRYLEQRDFALVAESCRERRILQRIAPYRVKPLPLLLPVYRHDQRPLWLMRLGMTLYDILAMYRNVAPHKTLSPGAAIELEPSMRSEGLVGAIRYYDCQEDDARFCIDNVFDAANRGACCANYCRVTGFQSEGDRLIAAHVSDQLAVGEFDICARMFINAAGPWVEQVAGLMTHSSDPLPRLSASKGTHILLPRLTQTHGIFFQARGDGRMMFVLPWNDCTLVGTTDTDFQGDPAEVRCDESDVEYLLNAVRGIFPNGARGDLSTPTPVLRYSEEPDRTSKNPALRSTSEPASSVNSQALKPLLSAGDVIATTAGVRPLLNSSAANPSARSREHQILRRGENLLSIAGGKYTTYRLIAEQVVDTAFRLLGGRLVRCTTAITPISIDRPPRSGEKIADMPEVYASDVEHAVRNEMAMNVEDVMRRRTGLSLSRYGRADVTKKVEGLLRQAGCQVNLSGIPSSLRGRK